MKNFSKQCVVLCCLLVWVFQVKIFPTDLCGPVSGTLTLAGSPYNVTCNVLVPDGQTLTIEPGVIIKFDLGHTLEVAGTLIAEGTDGNRIKFTSNVTVPMRGDWGKIYFNQSENSRLDYCLVEYAGDGANPSALNLWQSDVIIQNTIVQQSSSTGIVISDSSPSINNCDIEDNSGMGIDCIDPLATPIINNCLINNNLSYPISMHGRNIHNILSVTMTNNSPNRIRIESDNVGTGIWKNHNVPYEINGSISIVDGATLTINPGCKFYFAGDHTFEVVGKLIAIGNILETIIFDYEPGIPSKWRQFYFNNSDPGTMLESCFILNSGSNTGSNLAAVNMVNSNPTFNNVVIEKSETGGIRLANSSPELNTITVFENLGIGIHASDANSDPIINNFQISFNQDYAISMFADNIKNIGIGDISLNKKNSIRVEGETVYTGTWKNHSDNEVVPYVITSSISVADGETLIIEPGTELRFNSDYVFEVNGSLVAEGSENDYITFTSNKANPQPGDWRYLSFNFSDPATNLNYCKILYAGSNTTAVNMTFSSPTISNTLIQFSEQKGIYLSNSSPRIRSSTIRDNLGYGIHIVSGQPDLGTISSPGNNSFIKNSGWEVYNNTGDTIYAQENYWVDTDSATIDANHIYDDDENASKGIVVFMPYLKTIPTDVEEIIEPIVPNEFVLEQNYPNPFNPNTTIRFSIPAASYVTLEVFNAVGEKIGVLVSEELSAGTYKYDWKVKGLTSGIYFYRLSTENYSESKKMILLK